jgi:cytochrome c556
MPKKRAVPGKLLVFKTESRTFKRLFGRSCVSEGVIMLRVLAVLLIMTLITADAVADDPRTVVKLPAEMRDAFLEHMRDHMDSLDDLMSELAAGDFEAAATVAREELVPGSGAGFGRHLPIEFREIGLGMHRAAADFVEVAEAVPAEPTVEDWQKAMVALQSISAHCRACHAAFRVQ